MTSPNIKLWKHQGFAAETADRAIPLMMEAVKIMGSTYDAEIVFREACYQVRVLPDCAKEFQKHHAWKPPAPMKKRRKVQLRDKARHKRDGG